MNPKWLNVVNDNRSAKRLSFVLSNGKYTPPKKTDKYEFEMQTNSEKIDMVIITAEFQFKDFSVEETIEQRQMFNRETPVQHPISDTLENKLKLIIPGCQRVIAWTYYNVDKIMSFCKGLKNEIELYRANASLIETTAVPLDKILKPYYFNDPDKSAFIVRHEINFRISYAFSRLQKRSKPPCIDESGFNATLGLVMKLHENNPNSQPPRDLLPLTTWELTQMCSNILQLEPWKTLEMAQKLYKQGYISYPITDSDEFSPMVVLNEFVEKQTKHQLWGAFARQILSRNLSPRQGGHSQAQLEPIFPIKCDTLQDKGENKQNVYIQIVCHFLECLSKDVRAFPEYTTEGLTEAVLIRNMKEHQIGTAFTHPFIIQSLLNNGYIEIDQKRRIKPTTKAEKLYLFYKKYDVKLADLEWHREFLMSIGEVRLGLKYAKEILQEWLLKNQAEYEKMAINIDELNSIVSDAVFVGTPMES